MAYPADKATTLQVRAKEDTTTIMSYDLPSGTDHTAKFAQTLELDAAETDRQVDMSLLAEELHQFWVRPLSTGDTVLVGIERAGAGSPPVMDDSALVIASGGILIIGWDPAETPPILHLDNGSATVQVVVEIGGFAAFTDNP